jgi:hypothetical protein
VRCTGERAPPSRLRPAGFGGLESQGGLIFVGAVMLAIGGTWASSQPTDGMRAAYTARPEFFPFRVDFEPAVHELVATTLAGLQARGLDSWAIVFTTGEAGFLSTRTRRRTRGWAQHGLQGEAQRVVQFASSAEMLSIA